MISRPVLFHRLPVLPSVRRRQKWVNMSEGEDNAVGLTESPIPEASHLSRAVCRRSMPITRCGLFCVHGPVASRCPGSWNPPFTTLLALLAFPDSLWRPWRESLVLLAIGPLGSWPISLTKSPQAAPKLLWTVCSALPGLSSSARRGGHRRSPASRINLLIGVESDPTPDQLQPVPERRNNRPDRDPL